MFRNIRVLPKSYQQRFAVEQQQHNRNEDQAHDDSSSVQENTTKLHLPSTCCLTLKRIKCACKAVKSTKPNKIRNHIPHANASKHFFTVKVSDEHDVTNVVASPDNSDHALWQSHLQDEYRSLLESVGWTVGQLG